MGLWNMERDLLQNPSNFRKMSMGNWDGVYPPSVYGVFELDCEEVLPYLAELKQRTGLRITVNHLVGRVMALTLRRYPQLNGIIANHKIYLRKNVDIFFQVSIDDAETELVGICVRQADTLGLVEFAQYVTQKSAEVRASKAHPIRKAQNPFRHIPWRLVSLAIRLINWLQYDWNFNLSRFGIPQDAMGSLMITAVGSLGLEYVFVPLTRLGRSPAQLAVGHVHQKPVVWDDKITIRQRMNLCYTFDHRFMDGMLASKMAKYFCELFQHPGRYADLLEGRLPANTSIENVRTNASDVQQPSTSNTSNVQSASQEALQPGTQPLQPSSSEGTTAQNFIPSVDTPTKQPQEE